MAFILSGKTWLFTMLGGCLVFSINLVQGISSGAISFLFMMLILGGVFSCPAILVNWLGLSIAQVLKHPFERIIILLLSNVLANLSVLAIVCQAFGSWSSELHDAMGITWPFILCSFIFLFMTSRKIIFQPSPACPEEQENVHSEA